MGKNKGNLLSHLLTISILPFVISILLVLVAGYYSVTHAMHKEIYTELENAAAYACRYTNSLYPGDYHLEEEYGYRLYKGGIDITESYRIVDELKDHYGYEASLFYSDTRILTTVKNSDGIRRIATAAPSEALEKVLKKGETLTAQNVNVNGKPFFVCYAPLQNADGHTVGIFAVGRPQSGITRTIQYTVYPIILILVLTCIAVGVLMNHYTKSMSAGFGQIKAFLKDTIQGNLNAELSFEVLSRNDELGQIGQMTLAMQRSMRSMAEMDALTGLFNRRSAHRKLAKILEKSENQEQPFAMALGDIDFFKKVNDTYGHDCGDAVLKAVSDVLREHMLSCGFVSRWGGEEFLLIFDHSDIEEASVSMQKLLDKIREIEVPCEDQIVKVTMTFGVIQGENIPLKDLVSRADKLLYIGKHSGRNQIVLEKDIDKEIFSI